MKLKRFYLFILLYENLLTQERGWHTPIPKRREEGKKKGVKRGKKKRMEAQRAKPRTPPMAIAMKPDILKNAKSVEELQVGDSERRREERSRGGIDVKEG